jgi:PIN domain nuclease of toxin-antitoxin system
VGHDEVIVIDTHALIWWVGATSQISPAAREALGAADSIGVPSIVCLEIAILARRERIELPTPVSEWLADAVRLPNMELLPITIEIASTAAKLWARSAIPSI